MARSSHFERWGIRCAPLTVDKSPPRSAQPRQIDVAQLEDRVLFSAAPLAELALPADGSESSLSDATIWAPLSQSDTSTPQMADGGSERATEVWGQDLQEFVIREFDPEEGNLDDWTMPEFQYAGSGIFNTGGDDVSVFAQNDVFHSGRYGIQTTITEANGGSNRAVRLMAWTDAAWDNGGDWLPNRSYFSTWMYVPHQYENGDWWNVFQFKVKDANGETVPLWVTELDKAPGTTDRMELDLLYKENGTSNQPDFQTPLADNTFPIQTWVHLEAFYDSALSGGQIQFFINGVKVFENLNAITALTSNDTYPRWGIGNYTNQISGDPAGDGIATLYFDDVAISSQRMGANLDGVLNQPLGVGASAVSVGIVPAGIINDVNGSEEPSASSASAAASPTPAIDAGEAIPGSSFGPMEQVVFRGEHRDHMEVALRADSEASQEPIAMTLTADKIWGQYALFSNHFTDRPDDLTDLSRDRRFEVRLQNAEQSVNGEMNDWETESTQSLQLDTQPLAIGAHDWSRHAVRSTRDWDHVDGRVEGLGIYTGQFDRTMPWAKSKIWYDFDDRMIDFADFDDVIATSLSPPTGG